MPSFPLEIIQQLQLENLINNLLDWLETLGGQITIKLGNKNAFFNECWIQNRIGVWIWI
jgi:hypothetical protein